MSKTKKSMVSKVRKGCYKVKLPRQLSKKSSLKAKEPPFFDVVPLAVVGYVEVGSDGVSEKVNKHLRVWKISKGLFNASFKSKLVVKMVFVQVRSKPRSSKVYAKVAPLIRNRRVPNGMNNVEISLMNLRGEPVDCGFSMMGIAEGPMPCP